MKVGHVVCVHGSVSNERFVLFEYVNLSTITIGLSIMEKITLKTNLLNIDFSTIANSLMRKLNEKL